MQRKQEELSQGALAVEQEIMTLQSNNESVKVCPNIASPIIGNPHFSSDTHCLVFTLNTKAFIKASVFYDRKVK